MTEKWTRFLLRFTLRDLLWATALVAMGIGWWIDSQHFERLYTDKLIQNEELKAENVLLKKLRRVRAGIPPKN